MLLKILALFLIALPFLPLEFVFGQIRGIGGAVDAWGWFLSLVIFLPLVWFLSLILEGYRDRLDGFIKKVFQFYSPIVFYLHIIILFFILLFINWEVFSARPLLIDSVVQLFQAEIFSTGRIKTEPHLYPEFFMMQHVLFEEDGWYSQYPPLHSFMLMLGVLLGASWIMPPLMGALSILFVSLFTRSIFNKEVSIIALFMMSFSPFFLFMSGSFMNHVSALFFISGFLYFFSEWELSGKRRWIILAVLFGGFSFLVRPLTAISICFPFSIITIKVFLTNKNYKDLILTFLTALISPLLLIWFQLRTTSDPFLPAYIKLWGKGHGLGFHESPWGESHTFINGLRNELGDLRLLSEMLFEYPFPSLWLIGFFILFYKIDSKWFKRLLLSFFLIPFAYLFYWHRDAYLGPRFLYEGIACLIPISAYSLYHLSLKLDEKKFQILGLFIPLRIGTIIKASIFVSLLYVVFLSFPQRYMIYKSGMSSIKRDILAEAKENGIQEGIVFVKESWGSRLFARIRGFGVSASLSQKAYSYLDHCLLELEFNNALSNNLITEEFSNRLNELISKTTKVPSIKQIEALRKISQDKTLRLDPKRKLDEKCKEELRYDQTPFGIYYPFIRLNKADFSSPILFLRDLREENRKILELYPERKAYIYSAGRFSLISMQN